MARGGRRKGTPGTAYPNRTDLAAGPRTQAPRAATGQAYGVAGRQMAAQQAVPLPAPSPVPSAAPTPTPPRQFVQPGGHGPLDAPTTRPDEPLTAGLSTGPGPGPQAVLAGVANPGSDVEAQLLAMYKLAPNNDLLRLLRTARYRATQVL